MHTDSVMDDGGNMNEHDCEACEAETKEGELRTNNYNTTSHSTIITYSHIRSKIRN